MQKKFTQQSDTITTKTGLKLLRPFLKKNLKMLLLGLFFMIVVDAFQLIVPQIIKSGIDAISVPGVTKNDLLYYGLWILCFGVLMTILRYLWRMILMRCAMDLELGIRNQLFGHLLYLDAEYYDTTKAGDIMAHATSDINHVRMAFGVGIVVLVDTSLLGGAALLIMAASHLKLTLYAMLPMPLLIYVTKYLGKKTHDLHNTAQESFSTLTEQIRECFFGIRIIRVCDFTQGANQRFSRNCNDYYIKNLKRAIVMALLNPLMAFFFNLSTLIIMVYGGYLVIKNMLTPGELVAFLQYLGLLAWPIISIGWMINLYQRGMASLKRIGTILEKKPKIAPPLPGSKISSAVLKGGISFENVSFSPGLSQNSKHILSGINLEITPGTRVGISGPPGSGKTSLLRLIPRMYDIDKGSILLDGQDIRNFDPDHLRSCMGFMAQEPFLFSTTILENILMGRNISDNDLEELLHICDLSETIASMPKKLETITGERGVALSGGQKQRISLARALLGWPPILLLDDPISQLDTKTAHTILSRIRNVHMKNEQKSTSIIVSHRLSAIAGCDLILIMADGKIQAQGSHQELLKSSDFYHNTFHAQQFEETLKNHD